MIPSPEIMWDIAGRHAKVKIYCIIEFDEYQPFNPKISGYCRCIEDRLQRWKLPGTKVYQAVFDIGGLMRLMSSGAIGLKLHSWPKKLILTTNLALITRLCIDRANGASFKMMINLPVAQNINKFSEAIAPGRVLRGIRKLNRQERARKVSRQYPSAS